MRYEKPAVEAVLVNEEDVIRTSVDEETWQNDNQYGTPI